MERLYIFAPTSVTSMFSNEFPIVFTEINAISLYAMYSLFNHFCLRDYLENKHYAAEHR